LLALTLSRPAQQRVAVMSNGMQLMGVDQSIQSVITGLVLLLAVAFDVYDKRPAGTSR
jgi:putative multiple sugar transport system permease protein